MPISVLSKISLRENNESENFSSMIARHALLAALLAAALLALAAVARIEPLPEITTETQRQASMAAAVVAHFDAAFPDDSPERDAAVADYCAQLERSPFAFLRCRDAADTHRGAAEAAKFLAAAGLRGPQDEDKLTPISALAF